MNSIFRDLMLYNGVPAVENLVDDAVEANQTAETTDPEQQQKNVDFEAELARLDAAKPDADATAEDAGATDPAPGDDGAATADAVPGTDESDDDASEAADTTDLSDEAAEEPAELPADDEDALDSINQAIEALSVMGRAHDFGTVRAYHTQLAERTLEALYTKQAIAWKRPAIENEEAPEPTSNGRVQQFAGQVKDFIKKIWAQLVVYFKAFKSWIQDMVRAIGVRRAVYAKTRQSIVERIDYLANHGKIAEIQKANDSVMLPGAGLSALAVDDEISLAGFESTVMPYLASIVDGLTKVVKDGLITDHMASRLETLGGPSDTFSGKNGYLTPERCLLVRGKTSVFGTSKIVYDRLAVSDNGSRADVVLNGLGGKSHLGWSLASPDLEEDTSTAEKSAATFSAHLRVVMAYGARLVVDDPAVDSAKAIAWAQLKGALKTIDTIADFSEKLQEAVQRCQASSGVISKEVSEMMGINAVEILAKNLNLTDFEAAHLTSVYAAYPAAYDRLTLVPLMGLIRRCDQFQTQLFQLVVASLANIDQVVTGKKEAAAK